jgi:hypothetical protein
MGALAIKGASQQGASRQTNLATAKIKEPDQSNQAQTNGSSVAESFGGTVRGDERQADALHCKLRTAVLSLG